MSCLVPIVISLIVIVVVACGMAWDIAAYNFRFVCNFSTHQIAAGAQLLLPLVLPTIDQWSANGLLYQLLHFVSILNHQWPTSTTTTIAAEIVKSYQSFLLVPCWTETRLFLARLE